MTFEKIKIFFKLIFWELFATPFIRIQKGDFWGYRSKLISKKKVSCAYYVYLEKNNCYIGLETYFSSVPFLPHGLHGIHISDKAIIGCNCTIMQNVTIGSNSLKDSTGYGSPIIGDNVFVGANSVIIGKVKIGDNVRIGAGCCIYCDIPPNSTVVNGGGLRVLQHASRKDNNFYPPHSL